MDRKTYALKDKLQVTVMAIGEHGEGVASYLDKTVFIDKVLPGEVVEVQITEVKEKYLVAKVLKILQASPFRQNPPCPIFEKCGGCHLMNMNYQKQLAWKEEYCRDLGLEVEPIVGATKDEEHGYRNKVQVPIRVNAKGELVLGFFARGTNDVVSLESCLVHNPVGDDVFQKIKKIFLRSWKEKTVDFTSWRHLFLRTSLHENRVLVCLVTKNKPDDSLKKLAKEIQTTIKEVAGIWHNHNQLSGNTLLSDDYTHLSGERLLQEKLHGLIFEISPASFFQVNPLQAHKLYQTAMDLSELKDTETAFDAYCGVGTISLIAAKRAKKVDAVEIVERAIIDARKNAKLNKIENAHFFVGSTTDHIHLIKNADVVFLNPPRKGLEKKVLDELIKVRPNRIVYISCNPKTLVRDLTYLKKHGLEVRKVVPVDMFPQTIHVECVALI